MKVEAVEGVAKQIPAVVTVKTEVAAPPKVPAKSCNPTAGIASVAEFIQQREATAEKAATQVTIPPWLLSHPYASPPKPANNPTARASSVVADDQVPERAPARIVISLDMSEVK